MIKKRWFFLILILALMVFGCANARQEPSAEITQDNESEENGDMKLKITKEYLIENCGVTEDELKDVDLEGFLAYFSLNEENIKKYNIPALLKAFEKEQTKDKRNLSYSYLLDAKYEETGIIKEEIESIQKMAFYITKGSYQETIIFDLQNANGYWGKEQNLFKSWKEGVCQISLHDEERQRFFSIMEECHVAEWEKRYEGTSEDTMGSFGWSLYLEVEDGKVYYYSGSGVHGKNSPDSWTSFEKSMKDMFGEK